MAEEQIMERAIITCDVKADEEGGDRVLVFDGSTEDIDRMGEVIMAEGWDLKNYKKNPVFLWAHNYSMPPIGRAQRVWIDKDAKRLKFKIEFADAETFPFADTIYRLYKGGFMKATSVGFLPLEVEDIDQDDEKGKRGKQAPRRIYKRQELLELSAAPVPANPNALQNAVAAGIANKGDIDLLVKHFAEIGGPEASDEDMDFINKLTEATVRTWSVVEELQRTGTTTVTVPDVDTDDNGEDPEEKAISIGEVLKPYPNEHACRLKDPAQYDECRRAKRTATEPASVKGKEYSVIFCKKTGGKMEEQAYRYDKADWTAAQAKSHCQAHEGKFEPAEDAMHSEEVQGLWDVAQKTSQAGLMDELEYVIGLLEEVGVSKGKATDLCWELARTIMRLTGSDIPDDIAEAFKAPPDPEPALDFGTEAHAFIVEGVREGIWEVMRELKTKGV